MTLLALSAVTATRAEAQVGHLPDRSPFQDLVYRQRVTAYTGWYNASKDPAGVAPRSGPMIGVRYEIALGGPLEFMASTGVVSTDRRIIDPSQLEGVKFRGTQSEALWLADANLQLNLTGEKSWHRLVPVVYGGLGVASDFKGQDVGGYSFGTSFALSFGTGVRWIPGGRWQLRADLADELYQIAYPSTYFARAGDGSRVLSLTAPDHYWKHNTRLGLGASYAFYR